MLIIGLDPANYKNLGWSIVEVESETKAITEISLTFGTFTFPNQTPAHTVLWPMFLVLDQFFDSNPPHLVLVEATHSFGGMGFVTGQVAHGMGVILACCAKRKIPVKYVYPSHVKSVVAGSGKATKSVLRKAVKKILANFNITDLKFDSEHACDATANVLSLLIDNNVISKGQKDEPK